LIHTPSELLFAPLLDSPFTYSLTNFVHLPSFLRSIDVPGSTPPPPSMTAASLYDYPLVPALPACISPLHTKLRFVPSCLGLWPFSLCFPLETSGFEKRVSFLFLLLLISDFRVLRLRSRSRLIFLSLPFVTLPFLPLARVLDAEHVNRKRRPLLFFSAPFHPVHLSL